MASAYLKKDQTDLIETLEDPKKRSEMKAAIIKAGADVAVEMLRSAAKSSHNKKSTGDMAGSVSYSENGSEPNLSYGAEVYPRGLDRKKQSNAVKAFVLNYGRTSRLAFDGSEWFDKASNTAKIPIEEAMAKEFERQKDKIL